MGFERGPEFPQENNSRLPNVKCKVTSKECSIAKVSAPQLISKYPPKGEPRGAYFRKDPSLRSLPNIFGIIQIL